jgi:hypothetical protein
MVVIGCILLLPGFCAALYSFGDIVGGHYNDLVGGLPLIIPALLVAVAGIMLLRAASRGN